MNLADLKEQLEEAHGLWEIAIVRVSTLAEMGAEKNALDSAVKAEREAFAKWTAASNRYSEAK